MCPHLRIAGGVRAILTYADRLSRHGHAVTVVVPAKGLLGAWWRNVRGTGPDWVPGFGPRVCWVRELSARNLPDGDITLLNAKADKFAVFVRRVATQVFSQLRLSGWEHLNASDLAGLTGFSTVVAVMDKQGHFVSAAIEAGSGSGRFDAVLLQASRNGTRDGNPPAEAAATDGNIRFVFKSKSWSRLAVNPRFIDKMSNSLKVVCISLVCFFNLMSFFHTLQ